jgi:hypothetical protein
MFIGCAPSLQDFRHLALLVYAIAFDPEHWAAMLRIGNTKQYVHLQ